MIYLYKQEIFKLLKRKSIKICLLFIVLQNVGIAILSKSYPKVINKQEMFADNYASLSFIVFIMIAASATIISTEFEYNTIKNIVIQPYSRSMILISKWLTILTYTTVLYGLSMILTLINKLLWFNGDLNLNTTVKGISHPLWQYWIFNNIANFITLWLILSIVFLVAAIMKKGALAVVVGIIGYFAMSIIGAMMFALINKWEFLKWNPLNFLNYPSQLTHTGIITELTRLTNNELLVGNLVYIVLFMSLGLYFFSKKEV